MNLLAPNGKPSNLTQEQWFLVRTPEFKAWFGDWEKLALTKLNDSGIDEVSLKRLEDSVSKVVDENGEPQNMFHQTTYETKIKLYSKGLFQSGFESASKTDKETPYGFFFKKTDRDIGLAGKEQINVFLNAKNPLIFRRRNDINLFFNDIIDGYFENNLEYQKTDEKYKNQFDSLWEEAKKIDFKNKENLNKWDKESKSVLKEWSEIIDKISIEQKILLTNFFKNSEYDAMIIEFDEGSFGRKTDTTIVFNENQIKLADGTNTTFDGNNPDIRFKTGGKVSKTPAPKKEQIYGSKVNKEDSSANIKKAKSIKFDEKTILTISDKVKEHNKEYPNKKINLSSAKAVVRRGMGAYSSSHRPTITGGKPNSRVAWGLARLNAFIYKIINGKSKSGRYNQDDDLIKELGIMVKSYKDGGEIPKANKMFHLPIELTVYVPSTKDVDKVISKSEMNERVNEVKNYLGKTFGGFSATDVQGGFVASDGNIVNEDIIKVVSFAQKEDYEKHKEELVKKITYWAEKWGQEAIGLEYEGDLYYVPEKLKKGGSLDNTNYKKKESYWEGWGFSDRIKALLKGTKKNIIQAYKDLQIAFPNEEKEILQESTIEIFIEEKDLKRVKKIANYNNLTLMYENGGNVDYSQGWNQDYENDPLVKAKRKVKETAIRAGLAYATGGGSEVARAEGQAIQQLSSQMQNQQAQGQQPVQSQPAQGQPQIDPQMIQMLAQSGALGKMERGGNLDKESFNTFYEELTDLYVEAIEEGNIQVDGLTLPINKQEEKRLKKILGNLIKQKFKKVDLFMKPNFPSWVKANDFVEKNTLEAQLYQDGYGIIVETIEEKNLYKLEYGGQIDYAKGGLNPNKEVNKAFESLGDSNTKISKRFKRGGVTPKQQRKIAKVMREFKQGELHSGSKNGPIVKDREQAIAIALSEAGASRKMATGGSVIENFVNEMVKNQIARRTLRIKDQDKFNKFMQDIKPFVDRKIVRVKRNPIDKEEVWVSLQKLYTLK